MTNMLYEFMAERIPADSHWAVFNDGTQWVAINHNHETHTFDTYQHVTTWLTERNQIGEIMAENGYE